MKTIMLVFYTDVFIGDACRFEFKIIHSVYDLVAIYLMLALSTRNFIHTVNFSLYRWQGIYPLYNDKF